MSQAKKTDEVSQAKKTDEVSQAKKTNDASQAKKTDEVSQAKKTDEVSQAKFKTNIARGTTDPEMDSVTWTEFGNNTAPLALVANLATRWRNLHKLQIWPPIFVIRWHHLHCL